MQLNVTTGDYVSWRLRTGQTVTQYVVNVGSRCQPSAVTLESSDHFSEVWDDGVPDGARYATQREIAEFQQRHAAFRRHSLYGTFPHYPC